VGNTFGILKELILMDAAVPYRQVQGNGLDHLLADCKVQCCHALPDLIWEHICLNVLCVSAPSASMM
jgi:hypothetical protein